MKSGAPLDYAVFQLSPRHSRCELYVSSNGSTEKLASGLVKPFVAHLKVAEEQVAQAVRSIKLDVDRNRNGGTWFTKGTLERFVRFVSTPEVLEMVNTYDTEMSQLESARKLYSQGTRERLPGALGGDGRAMGACSDTTQKELLRAIDVRLTAVRQDLTGAYARAAAAGFNPESVSDLQLFSDCFGAHRLNEACTKFISLCGRRPDLITPWKPGVEDQLVRASWGSDMSLDDPPGEPSGSHNQNKHQAGQEQLQRDLTQTQIQNHLNQSKGSNFNQNSALPDGKEEEKKQEESSVEPLPIQSSQPSRRLSVQDRINLFENKQKESSGGKTVPVTKPAELRRLSSDVSSAAAADRAVLRRWSGASDMSIDLGNDKKENNGIDSPLVTPSSSIPRSNSNVFSGSLVDDKDQGGLNDTAGSGSIDKVGPQSQLKPFAGIGDQGVKEEKFNKGNSGGDERSSGVKDQADFEGKLIGNFDRGETLGANSQARRVGDVEVGNRAEDAKIKEQLPNQSRSRGPQTHSRSFSGQFEGGYGIKVKEVSYKETGVDQPAISGEIEQVRKVVAVSAKEPTRVGDLEIPKRKVQKPLSPGPEQMLKMQGRREDSGSMYAKNKLGGPSMKASEDQDSFSIVPGSSTEQVQRARQSKGNQGLNDELKMKANELEKLFAEHKLRVPGDQSNSTRRSKAAESQVEQAISSQYKKPVEMEIHPAAPVQDKKTAVEVITNASDNAMFSTPPSMKVDHHDFGSAVRQNFSELSLSDDSRGKCYEKYMQRRDAKLKEEWGTKRAEKEAKLRSMQDSLERSRAELKATFSGSADRLDTASSAHQRAEKLRLYHSRSSMKRGQHLVDIIQSEEDEDPSESLEHKYSRSSQNKKMIQNRNTSTSTPRTAAAPVPRSSAKISNPRRRVQSENPLAQSVPNFSDFRKENTKPSSGISKTANRAHARPYARSKSTTEEAALIKEEKHRRSQSLRKSSAGPAEFKDIPPLNSNDIVLAPLKFDKEQTEYEKVSRNADSKPFLRKGSGLGPGAGTAKLKASMSSDVLKNEEEFEKSAFEVEDPVNVAKEEEAEDEEDELDPIEVEDYASNENGKPRLSQESDKMSESDNGDSQRFLSQVDPSSVAELPSSIPPTFHVQDSPSESPVSWNSRLHNPFSYPHEISDIDASVDSPIGSPAWNSHSLAQTEADAARMRKKWGSAQKPFLVANSSHNQPRKDVTKGFKRLLKFGRKSRGTDSLVDWISATTSEGDDDTEDGRDPANRSSDDLRKSRMGFSQSHASDDGFHDSELFNDVQAIHSSIPAPPANFKLRDDHMSGSSIKAPRSSFFSLSSFRSKGSESKLR
ncbi:hypothetical protein M5689_020348 [Euphorbia peplus]|nr:hypothetical protein M5689_020348 [Euphorbia peplus]